MSWTAALVESCTQAQKTRKTFEVLANKLHGNNQSILCLFITQANSTMSAMQIINRITHHEDLLELFPKDNIIRSSKFDEDFNGNLMIVDFWNSKNTLKMLDIVKEYQWDKIVIIQDECDSGNVKAKLTFIQEVELYSNAEINVIFITSTIPNYSEKIYKIFLEDIDMFKDSIIEKIITEKCIEKHHAKPHQSYVGTSWYKNTPGAWIDLVIVSPLFFYFFVGYIYNQQKNKKINRSRSR